MAVTMLQKKGKVPTNECHGVAARDAKAGTEHLNVCPEDLRRTGRETMEEHVMVTVPVVSFLVVIAAKREGKWMHYRIEAPKDIAGRRVLDAVFACLRQNKTMQADRMRLSRTCCNPGKYVAAQGAPVPTAIRPSARMECH